MILIYFQGSVSLLDLFSALRFVLSRTWRLFDSRGSPYVLGIVEAFRLRSKGYVFSGVVVWEEIGQLLSLWFVDEAGRASARKLTRLICSRP